MNTPHTHTQTHTHTNILIHTQAHVHTNNDVEMKLTSIKFTCQITKGTRALGCRSWVTSLTIVLQAFCTLRANISYYIMYMYCLNFNHRQIQIIFVLNDLGECVRRQVEGSSGNLDEGKTLNSALIRINAFDL